ncbi:MAG: sigma 54-interacting transcriptional regulator [Desulfobacterales bacterium]
MNLLSIRKDKRGLMNSHENTPSYHKMDVLKAILDASDGGIMVLDKNGSVLFTNPKFSDIWAFPQEIIEKNDTGRLLFEYILEQLEEPTSLPWNLKDIGRISSEMLKEIKLKDGRALEIFSYPLQIDDQAIGCVYKFRDITERNRAKEELMQEKRFSETVLDSLPGIFYLYDEDGNLIRWNKNHEVLTGFSTAELPKRKMLDWFSGADKEYITARVEDVFAKGWTEAEADLVVKSGKKIPYYFTGSKLTVADRQYLLGVGIDLTEIKKVEEALRKSEEKYRQIFEYAVEGIYQTTPEGRFISVNPAMANILGYDSPQSLIDEIKDIRKQLYVSQNDRDDFIRLIKQNQAVKEFEVQFYRKDNKKIWVSLHARPVYDDKGNLGIIEGFISDITERKEATEALRESEEYFRKENIRLRSNIKDRYKFGDIIGKSPAMQEVYELILKAAASDANVIIYGESGTGKELAARAVHNMSDRKDNNFVPVNCGAIPENLLESEFFGYLKGAFTGAYADKNGYLDIADNGTLFLDELGEIDLNMQVKLLRVLEGGGFTPVGGHQVKKPDVRIIAATNRDLQSYVTKGLMREDFFYRIHIIPIYMPPLKERKEDIPLLIDHFMNAQGDLKKRPPITGRILDEMLGHEWPGNVRELQNVLHRFFTLDRLDLSRTQGVTRLKEDDIVGDLIEQENNIYQTAMENFEKNLFHKTLEHNQWHREKAAQTLGLPLRTFYRKMKRLGLKRHN